MGEALSDQQTHYFHLRLRVVKRRGAKPIPSSPGAWLFFHTLRPRPPKRGAGSRAGLPRREERRKRGDLPQFPGQLWYKSLPHQRKKSRGKARSSFQLKKFSHSTFFLAQKRKRAWPQGVSCQSTNRLSPNTPGINPSENTKYG